MLIPLLVVRDIAEAIAFYTRVLDFAHILAFPDDAPFYAVLMRDGAELHLNKAHHGRAAGGSTVIVLCEDVDAVFAACIARGLCVPARADSPVHLAPVDQSWGTRELYIDDPSGNTIVWQQRAK